MDLPLWFMSDAAQPWEQGVCFRDSETDYLDNFARIAEGGGNDEAYEQGGT